MRKLAVSVVEERDDESLNHGGKWILATFVWDVPSSYV